MGRDDEARSELARFLRRKRELLTPADVGLSEGTRRRTTGLRRSEVAVLAGLSTSWYTYLEQGRDIQPSRGVLDRLAHVLRMTEDERRYVQTLVYNSYGPLDPLLIEPMSPEAAYDRLVLDVVETTYASPLPVYACNKYFDLIGWNPACVEWYDDWGKLDVPDRNIVQWVLVADAAREVLVDWDEITRDLIARFRAEHGRRPGDPRLMALIEKFTELSPLFAEAWQEHEVLEHRVGVRRFRHPELGVRSLRIAPVLSPAFGTSGIVFHVPA